MPKMILMELSKNEFVSLIAYIYKNKFSKDARQGLAEYYEERYQEGNLDPVTLCLEVDQWTEFHSQEEFTKAIRLYSLSKEEYMKMEKIQLSHPNNFLIKMGSCGCSLGHGYDDKYLDKMKDIKLLPFPSLK